MPLPAQFQLGVELTNIVNPLSQAISAIGSLTLVDANKKAGSDAITEMRMASLIGRHRIDEVIKWHFREQVAKADQTIISRYMDIVLEAGSGPTVQEALKNPALFSMVIQLSALAYVHEDESLANAMVEAIERIIKESGPSESEMNNIPDYVSLLGTIRACRQQTAAFPWAVLYDAVEDKIALLTKDACSMRKKTSKKRKVSDDPAESLESTTNRNLPFPVLQALIMWLHSIQSFPEHRLLHLMCDCGISTAVVWCHHVLGLNVKLVLRGVEICFGDGVANVLIEECALQHAGASLMDPADANEPLFDLTSNENTPTLSYESRAELHGFGIRMLKNARLTEEVVEHSIYWSIYRCLSTVKTEQEVVSNIHRHPRRNAFPSYDRVVRAAQVLFNMDSIDTKLVDSYGTMSSSKVERIASRPGMLTLAALLRTVACIEEDDLEKCMKMPLSLYQYQRLYVRYDTAGPYCSNIIESFKILSHLLLGHMYDSGYVSPAVLVSAWGWSIFFDVIDKEDPRDVSVNSLRVLFGVPSRRGLRRQRIIDGPIDSYMSDTTARLLMSSPRVSCFPGISSARKGSIMIGHHSDAFQVVQTFNWRSEDRSEKVHNIGFRGMLEMRVKAKVLDACKHGDGDSEWFRALLDQGMNEKSQREGGLAASSFYEMKWSDAKGRRNDRTIASEAVFTRQYKTHQDANVHTGAWRSLFCIWFFFVSDNCTARWLQLNAFCQKSNVKQLLLAMRGKETCLKCAVNDQALTDLEDALVLL